MTAMHSTALGWPWRVFAGFGITLAVLAGAGCQTLGYYSHAALGQLRVLTARQPVEAVLARLEQARQHDPRDEALHAQLTLARRLLGYAEAELGLVADGRYQSYVALDRPAVVWNVFAAPPLSLTPYQWCYPLVGCTPYRGFFNAAYADRSAQALERRGFETFVGPVAAYSTLGWFDDPLLSTFIGYPEAELAELLFHELAHGEVWLPGDVAFNESFATFVGRRGASQWLAASGRHEDIARRSSDHAARKRLLGLLAETRAALQQVYQAEVPDPKKLEAKTRVLEGARRCYAAYRSRLGGGRYDALMAGLNNARLASVAAYEDHVPGFARLFAESGGAWPEFYQRVRAIAELQPDARAAALAASGDEQIGEGGDDDRAHEIQCQPFLGHLLDGESAR